MEELTCPVRSNFRDCGSCRRRNPAAGTAAGRQRPVGIYIGPEPQYPQQAQQPPRGGAWGDRDRDGVPNVYDPYNNNRRRGMGDQDRDGIPNRYDTDRDGDGRPNQWDRSPTNPHR